MKKIFLLAAIAIAVTGLVSCEQPNEDVVQTPDRSGSVEANFSTEQYKDSTILTVNYTVYKNNQAILLKQEHDTIPGLGMTVVEGEDSEGNTQQVPVPKQYEFYVTVK